MGKSGSTMPKPNKSIKTVKKMTSSDPRLGGAPGNAPLPATAARGDSWGLDSLWLANFMLEPTPVANLLNPPGNASRSDLKNAAYFLQNDSASRA